MEHELNVSDEKFYNGLDQRVTRVETKLDNLGAQLSGVITSVDHLANTMAERGKPNWQVWIAAAGLIFVILTGIGGTVLAPIYLRTAMNTQSIQSIGVDTPRRLSHLEDETWKLGRDMDRLHPRTHVDQGESDR